MLLTLNMTKDTRNKIDSVHRGDRLQRRLRRLTNVELSVEAAFVEDPRSFEFDKTFDLGKMISSSIIFFFFNKIYHRGKN